MHQLLIIMYTQSFLALALTALVTATPLEKRLTGPVSNEFTQGGCKDVMFAFARGSTEIGNMVSLLSRSRVQPIHLPRERFVVPRPRMALRLLSVTTRLRRKASRTTQHSRPTSCQVAPIKRASKLWLMS